VESLLHGCGVTVDLRVTVVLQWCLERGGVGERGEEAHIDPAHRFQCCAFYWKSHVACSVGVTSEWRYVMVIVLC
jgi:hypothetical protein